MRKNMKKSRFAFPLIALVVCLVLVTGSTFSLFTSQTGANIAITSGTVKLTANIAKDTLKLYSKGELQTGNFANGGFADFNESVTEIKLNNITPGDSVTFNIILDNDSNVDLQYRVNWIVKDVPYADGAAVGKLSEVLVATANGKDITTGTSQWIEWGRNEADKRTISISIEFPMGVEGVVYNDYMNCAVNIALNVEAVQANGTVEFSPKAYVDDATGLQDAIDAGAKEIILNGNIDLNDTLVFPATVDTGARTYARRSTEPFNGVILNLNGHTLTSNVTTGVAIENYGELRITGGTIEVNENVVAFANCVYTPDTEEGEEEVDYKAPKAELNGVKLNGAVASVGQGAKLELTDSTITVTGVTPAISASEQGTVIVNSGSYTNEAENGVAVSGNVQIDGGNFDGAIEGEGENVPVISGGNFTEIPEDVEINGNFVVDFEGNNTVVPEGVKESDLYIVNLNQLKKFAESVNNGNRYAGKTVALATDIDLAGEAWTPIGTSSNPFEGHFDGYGATISNLVAGAAGQSNIGFFGYTQNGSVKNLHFVNAKLTGRLNIGVVSGTPYTSTFDNITIKGHVEINGLAYVGGALGKNAYADVSNITIEVDETSYVKAYSIENGSAYRTYVGGVIGFMGEGEHTVSNIKSNINVFGSTCDVGGIVGIAHYGNKFENITCTGNVTITDAAEAGDADEMGGIAGVWHNQTGYTVTFIDCVFNGTLSANITEGLDLSDNTITGAAYSASGEGTLVIKNYIDIEGITYLKDAVNNVLSLYLVPEEYEGDTVEVVEGTYAIGNYAFAYNNNVKTVILASTVRDLGRGFDSSSVEKVVLNEGLTTISSRAFRSTSALKEVVFSTTVTVIEDNAFQKSSIKEIVIPASVTTIGETAFGASLIEKVTFEGDIDIQGYAFRGCTKLNTVVLNGLNVNFVKSTLNGRNSCWFCNGESNNPNTSNITFYVKTNVIKDRVLTAMGAEKNNTTVNVEMTSSENGYDVDGNGNAYVYTADQLVAALEAKCDVVFCNDIKIEPASMSNAYGATGINVKYGQTIDGNGYTLNIKGAGGTWDSGINTTGGVIKNLTVTGSFRGIFINHTSSYSAKVVLENVTLTGVTYTISCDQGLYQGIEATNCTFNGWTSFAATAGEAKFINCNFGEGNGYAYCRPYSNTEFVNCTFSEGYGVDTTRATVTFTGCSC